MTKADSRAFIINVLGSLVGVVIAISSNFIYQGYAQNDQTLIGLSWFYLIVGLALFFLFWFITYKFPKGR